MDAVKKEAGTIRLAVLGMNQGSKTARDAVANPEVDLVAAAGRDE